VRDDLSVTDRVPVSDANDASPNIHRRMPMQGSERAPVPRSWRLARTVAGWWHEVQKPLCSKEKLVSEQVEGVRLRAAKQPQIRSHNPSVLGSSPSRPTDLEF
jgi:hypothetical protein